MILRIDNYVAYAVRQDNGLAKKDKYACFMDIYPSTYFHKLTDASCWKFSLSVYIGYNSHKTLAKSQNPFHMP